MNFFRAVASTTLAYKYGCQFSVLFLRRQTIKVFLFLENIKPTCVLVFFGTREYSSILWRQTTLTMWTEQDAQKCINGDAECIAYPSRTKTGRNMNTDIFDPQAIISTFSLIFFYFIVNNSIFLLQSLETMIFVVLSICKRKMSWFNFKKYIISKMIAVYLTMMKQKKN